MSERFWSEDDYRQLAKALQGDRDNGHCPTRPHAVRGCNGYWHPNPAKTEHHYDCRLKDLIAMLQQAASDARALAQCRETLRALEAWANTPFKPTQNEPAKGAESGHLTVGRMFELMHNKGFNAALAEVRAILGHRRS